MRVGFATRDWALADEDGEPPKLGGSGYYRVGLPARALADAGHDVVVGTLLSHNTAVELGVKTWDGEPHWHFDVVVLQRWMFADLPGRIAECVREGLVVLNDLDDDFARLDPANRAYKTSSTTVSKIENREHYLRSIAASSAVTVSTPYLAARYPNSILCRNGIDWERWTAGRVPDAVERTVEAFPGTVGWVGALPWRSGDVETLRGLLGPFAERHGLGVVHSGHLEGARDFFSGEELPTFAERVGVPEDLVEKRPMASIVDYPALFDGIGIGVVPLSDRPFNEAKSAIKGMEYAAAGVPFVAQATPEYRWLAEEAGIGRTARRPRDWIRELERLTDPAERAHDVVRNRIGVERLGLDFVRDSWGRALEAAVGRPSVNIS